MAPHQKKKTSQAPRASEQPCITVVPRATLPATPLARERLRSGEHALAEYSIVMRPRRRWTA